jgi:hypothetical protein
LRGTLGQVTHPYHMGRATEFRLTVILSLFVSFHPERRNIFTRHLIVPEY